jgi:hypothetical protein
VIFRCFVEKEIGPGESAGGLIAARGIVRDDDHDQWNHQSLDVSEGFDPTAIPKRRVQDRDIRFPIQNHLCASESSL